MTHSTHHLIVVAYDIAIGNAIAGLIGIASKDNETFTHGIPLREIGGTVEVAKAATPYMTDRGAAYVTELESDGPYPMLTNLGATPEFIAAAKNSLHMLLTTSDAIPSAKDFYTTLSLEVIPSRFAEELRLRLLEVGSP
jgi:hypothetical protein